MLNIIDINNSFYNIITHNFYIYLFFFFVKTEYIKLIFYKLDNKKAFHFNF